MVRHELLPTVQFPLAEPPETPTELEVLQNDLKREFHASLADGFYTRLPAQHKFNRLAIRACSQSGGQLCQRRRSFTIAIISDEAVVFQGRGQRRDQFGKPG